MSWGNKELRLGGAGAQLWTSQLSPLQVTVPIPKKGRKIMQVFRAGCRRRANAVCPSQAASLVIGEITVEDEEGYKKDCRPSFASPG
jgi:hypothetical protein